MTWWVLLASVIALSWKLGHLYFGWPLPKRNLLYGIGAVIGGAIFWENKTLLGHEAATPILVFLASLKLLECGLQMSSGSSSSPSSAEAEAEANAKDQNNPCSSAIRALSSIPYASNAVYLHTDAALMPRDRRAWASWNCLQASSPPSSSSSASNDDSSSPSPSSHLDPSAAPVCVTYWLNRLQRLPPNAPDTFVTLNPPQPPCPSKTLRVLDLDHPVFGPDTPRAQELLQKAQGQGGIYFAGAWCGYGFHEDGMASAVAAVRAMGGDLPWDEFVSGKSGASEGGVLSSSSPSSPSIVIPPRIPSPKLSALDRLAIATFDKFARSAVASGRLTVILPNGEQLDYGSRAGLSNSDPSSSSSVFVSDPLTAPLTRPGEEWRGAPVRRATLRVVDAAFFRKVITRHDTGLGVSFNFLFFFLSFFHGEEEIEDTNSILSMKGTRIIN